MHKVLVYVNQANKHLLTLFPPRGGRLQAYQYYQSKHVNAVHTLHTFLKHVLILPVKAWGFRGFTDLILKKNKLTRKIPKMFLLTN